MAAAIDDPLAHGARLARAVVDDEEAIDVGAGKRQAGGPVGGPVGWRGRNPARWSSQTPKWRWTEDRVRGSQQADTGSDEREREREREREGERERERGLLNISAKEKSAQKRSTCANARGGWRDCATGRGESLSKDAFGV